MMLEHPHHADARRRRQIEMLDVDYLVRAAETSATALDACSRRSMQILFDASVVLKTADERLAFSRRLLDGGISVIP